MNLKVPEKRKAICYGFIKERNKKWLQAQAKKQGLKVSPTLDLFLDKLRERYPLKSERRKKK
jgi:hypothetical protein